MNIKYACYQGVMMVRGGPLVQISETKQHLLELGVNVSDFNMWDSAESNLSADLVHIFSSNFAVYDLARKLMERGRPFVVSPIFYTRRSAGVVRAISRFDELSRKFMRGMWWDFGFTRDVCSWAEAVLPNTTDEAELIHRAFTVPKERIHVVPNGVSENFMHGDPDLFRKKYRLENFVLNVGHIGPDRKNILALVQALAKIDHPAVIIGRVTPGGQSEAVFETAKTNKNLLIIDGLDHDSPMLASAYAACDVFAMPSKFETPGIAALEAALAGAKIVITPHGGTKDYFIDKAIYVDPYRVENIRTGIETALNTTRDENLKQHIVDNFLWKRVAEKTLKVYEQVLER